MTDENPMISYDDLLAQLAQERLARRRETTCWADERDEALRRGLEAIRALELRAEKAERERDEARAAALDAEREARFRDRDEAKHAVFCAVGDVLTLAEDRKHARKTKT